MAYVFDKGQIIRDEKGRALRMVGGILDITSRKNAENQVIIQNNRLRQYAHVNSHKVRAPLARIMGLINVLKSGQAAQESNQVLNYLSNSSLELDAILKEIAHLLDQDSGITDLE